MSYICRSFICLTSFITNFHLFIHSAFMLVLYNQQRNIFVRVHSVVTSLYTLYRLLFFKFTETSRQVNVLSFINMSLLVLLEPHSWGSQSSLIGIPCYHYGDELIVYLYKMTYKDLKASLRNKGSLDVYFYGPREEKPYFRPNYIVQASELSCQ